eukprot:2236161-Prymnesium_polylepis.1
MDDSDGGRDIAPHARRSGSALHSKSCAQREIESSPSSCPRNAATAAARASRHALRAPNHARHRPWPPNARARARRCSPCQTRTGTAERPPGRRIRAGRNSSGCRRGRRPLSTASLGCPARSPEAPRMSTALSPGRDDGGTSATRGVGAATAG